jgi:phosphoserine aminotransferase
MNATGIGKLRETNRLRAAQLYEVLERSEYLEPFVHQVRFRSPTVIVSAVRDGNKHLHRQLMEQGVVLTSPD